MTSLLILEDDPDLQKALLRLVERYGYNGVGAGSVTEALELVARMEFDAILADIILPDGSGLEFLRRLRDTGSRIPTILMTGLTDLSLAAEGMQAGAADFLTKPLDLGALRTALGAALRNSALDDPATGRDAADRVSGRGRVVGRHPSIVDLYKRIGMAAFADTPVLIRGETGVGKELVAREIHHHSRPGRPFEAVNSASVPDSLLQSILFGHAAGAFTGATSDHRGHFQVAADGTLFLDEIGDASPSFQTTLLRTIQERQFTPVGGETARPFEARLVAATNRSLEEEITEGLFREDLYYRLQVFEIEIPPLRRRMSDLELLSNHMLQRAADRMGWRTPALNRSALERLSAHDWPGNVRELENVLERAILHARGGPIDGVHIDIGNRNPESSDGASTPPDPDAATDERLETAVFDHVLDVLTNSEGNKREAARRLGISPGRLYRILESPPADLEERPE